MSKKIIQLNEEIIKGELKELVRSSVEETLNNLLDQEAKVLTQAAKYERTEARQGYRAGHYDRNLTMTSGNVTLKYLNSKAFPLKLPSSNDIAAGKARWKKPSLKCIWLVFLSGE
jgi:hypothetical protein